MPNAASVFRPGATALITGGASGVGLAIVKLCASHGMNVIILDRNSKPFAEIKKSIESKGTIETYEIDVETLADWQVVRSVLENEGRKLDFLVLNAGIQMKGDWTDDKYFKKIFDVNLFGVINGINTFFPHFESNSGDSKAIVVTGSKQGITNPPGNPAYNATKAAVKTITEHLSFDLAKSAPSTSVHLLVPGWTFTGLTGGGNLTEKPAGAWAPDQVADYLYKKMQQDKFYVICPDNDVDWETDRKRMTWSMGDVVFERQPQSRWRDEYKEESAATMDKMRLGEKQAD